MEKFKRGDMVLVKEKDGYGDWYAKIFAGENGLWTYFADGSGRVTRSIYMLPLNDGTEHLLGTSKEYTPECIPDENTLVTVKKENRHGWCARVFLYKNMSNGRFVCRGVRSPTKSGLG